MDSRCFFYAFSFSFQHHAYFILKMIFFKKCYNVRYYSILFILLFVFDEFDCHFTTNVFNSISLLAHSKTIEINVPGDLLGENNV